MVEKIEIKNQNEFIILDKKQKELIINGIKKEFKEEKFNKLLNIMALWKNKYQNNQIIDGIKVDIKIYTNNSQERIIIQNAFPPNFQEFLDIIGDIYE